MTELNFLGTPAQTPKNLHWIDATGCCLVLLTVEYLNIYVLSKHLCYDGTAHFLDTFYLLSQLVKLNWTEINNSEHLQT